MRLFNNGFSWLVVVQLIVFGILKSYASSNVPNIVTDAKSKATYHIPDSMTAKDDIISRFKAVSSHGRSDESSSSAISYSTMQIMMRSAYLLLVFSPVFMTSGFALISSLFRNLVWYRLLQYSIGNGGAVRK